MGYETERFIHQPDKNLLCCVCQDVLKEPRSCSTGHAFCRVCIETILRGNSVCPVGRCPIPRQPSRVIALEGLIQGLAVYCPHRDSEALPPPAKKAKGKKSAGPTGCRWSGLLSESQKHVEKDCLYQAVACAYDDCPEEGPRAVIHAHLPECPKRPVDCELCGDEVVFDSLAAHQRNVCPRAELPCRHGCLHPGARPHLFPREELADHYEECPRAPVACPLASIGCKKVVMRREVEAHARAGAPEHVTLLAAQLAEARHQVEAQGRLIAKQSTTISTLEDRLTQLNNTIAVHSADLDQLKAPTISAPIYSAPLAATSPVASNTLAWSPVWRSTATRGATAAQFFPFGSLQRF
eukprot:TRINITY_DN1065_c0_g1_i3.p1 TRINITY_DN1065_c0_g1~~TRINITY_DN1065_c0_g1_i3.p1  ORF type:complete len:352 (+),score=9.66 TRINITY_DN1065_c0_g1_i3:110-1165(+)